MYYCLADRFVLRGWEKLPTGLVDRVSGSAIFFEPNLYTKLCDLGWMLFEGSPFITPEEAETLARLEELRVLELCDHARPLTEDQTYRSYPNRYLREVHWAITGACNCRCRHCYLSAPSREIREYSYRECEEIIDQMEAAGIASVSLTGGEALIRSDFLKIAERLTDAGIRISTIMSNGLLVGRTLLESLQDMGQKPQFNMSFDGIGTHDWLRGIEGAERRVLRAFEFCAEYGFSTAAEYCLHRDNVCVLRQSIHLLGSLGCEYLKVNGLSPEGEALGILDHVLSTEEEYQCYLDYLPDFYEDDEPLQLILSGMFASYGDKKADIPYVRMSEDADCDNFCLCGHARSYMYLTEEGYIVPCIPMGSTEAGKRHFPNIRDTSLSDAIKDSFYMSFIDTRLRTYFDAHPECAACEYRNRCGGGCRGNAVSTGGIMGRDEKSCAFFRGGFYDRVKALLRELGVSLEREV